LLRPGACRRIDLADLQPDEWRIADLARELGMSAVTLHHWYNRGWVTGRKSSPVGGCWIFWADKPELERLRLLRAAHRRGYNRECPAELKIPGSPRRQQPHRQAKTARRSGRKPPQSRRRKRD
jgi:DNA-binding transcriptional MerR regulator